MSPGGNMESANEKRQCSPWWVPLRVVLSTLAAAVCVICCHAQNNPARLASNPFSGSNEAAAEGRDIFNRICTECHGHDGAGGDRAPALAANARRYLRTTDNELFDAIE